MSIILLDAGGAGLALAVLAIFILIAVVTEAVVMLIIRYNNFGKAFLDSFLANIASLVAGYLLLALTGDIFSITDGNLVDWIVFLTLTIAAEFGVLYLINRSRPLKRTLAAAIIMNIVSYIILYFIVD